MEFKTSGIVNALNRVVEKLSILNTTIETFEENNDGWLNANETWTYSSVDNPTGVFTISGDKTTKYSLGMKIRFSNGGNVIYGIITKISYSSPNTTVTFLHEIDTATPTQAKNIIANSAISANYYAIVKAPFEFPMNPNSWTIQKTDTSNYTQATPAQNTWYNLGTTASQIIIPIGEWNVEYSGLIYANRVTIGQSNVRSTLSTANNSESDKDFHVEFFASSQVNAVTAEVGGAAYKRKILELTAKTTYYLNLATNQAGMNSMILVGANQKTIIRAICAYL